MKAWLAIVASVILVTIAQLGMKWGMSSLPSLLTDLFNFDQLLTYWQPLLWVGFGLGCYALSLGCWMVALTTLPLSIAYPCLSVSYILVALSAWQLFGEPLSWATVCGSLLIFIGVTLIAYPPTHK